MDSQANLSDLSTAWSDLRAAHGADPIQAQAAQTRLLERYGLAVRRYLQAAVRDSHAADDLFQEFAVRLLRGSFGSVSAERGSFRGFLKTVLQHLVIDWQRRQKRLAPAPDALGLAELADTHGTVSLADADDKYIAACKEHLFEQAWEELRRTAERRGKPLHSILRYRTDHPEMRSANIAERMSAELGRPLTAGQVRKYLMEAREALVDGLVAAAALSVVSPTAEILADELEELGLLEYCQEGLGRWNGAHR
jgi:RNA polymerase sigma-70 factor (ECF subfamily)